MIFSIIIAVVVATLVTTAQNVSNGITDSKIRRSFRYLTGDNFIQSIGIGLVTGAISYFTSICEGMLCIAPILLGAVIALFVLLAYECWESAVYNLTSILPFAALAVIFWLVSIGTANATSALFTSALVARVICAIPQMLLIASLAFIVYAVFKTNYVIDRDERYHGLSIATIAVAVIALVATCAPVFGDNAGIEESAYAADNKVAEEDDSPYWSGIHFYNDEVRKDSDQDNDYNFGPNPYVDGKDVDYYVEDFESRRSEDPALLAATMLALDNTINTDYIGSVLYAEYDEKLNVLQRADAATKVLAGVKGVFDDNHEAVSAMLDSAKSVKLVKKSKISDQLYMNGYTADGIPQVVIYETDVTSDWCLVYTFKIKTSEVQIAFRIPCGYQWTNPYEVLKENASSTSSGGIGGGIGGGSSPVPSPSPKPSPTPTPSDDDVKDPSKDPVNQGNADVGGGKNQDTDGTGDYQPEKPSKDSGSNSGGGSSSGGSSGGSGSSPSSGSGKVDPITPHSDSHDSGGSSAGDNNGEFSMD